MNSLPLAASSWGEAERIAAFKVVDSGRTTMGEYVARFEREFARYIGTEYAVMVNSGSSANLLMVAAYTLIDGKGTVVVPALGWSTSYAPFQQYGWKLRFVDIDRETLNFDHEGLWKAAAPGKTKDDADLILAINVLGNPCDFMAMPGKIPVLEDNCESLGATYRGKKTGSLGKMGSHSLFFSHHICTMEGGVVTTNYREYYEMLLALRSHGWTHNLPEKNGFREAPSAWRFVVPGYNVRPLEISAAIGLEQLKRLPSLVAQRRDNAARFPFRTQKETERSESSWYGFALLADDVQRLRCQLDERGVEHRPVLAGNFLRHPAAHYFDYTAGPLLNADYVHDHGVMIGNHGTQIDWSILDGIDGLERKP